MKYNRLILLLFLITFKTVSAQHIELINSGEVIKKAVTLYDSSHYKEALVELNKVSRSDTNYVWALAQKAVTCEADSQFTQGLKYCEEALSLKDQREYEPDVYNTYGNLLTGLGQPEKAIKVFDAAIAKYPSFSFLYFNKAVAMSALKRPDEAEKLFQQTLLINPYMYSAHYQLGMVALRQGKIVQSALCFIGYLLVNPEGKYWSNSIKMLNQISRGTDELMQYKNGRTVAPDDNYQAMEDIVLAKLALDAQYKPIIALDDAISRQIQVIFEKLEYNDQNKDFYIQYYLPYYKKVYSEGNFELFINHLFSNVNVPVIQEYNKKNKKALSGFTEGAADYFNLLRSTRELMYKNRDSVTQRYLFENGKLIGKGTLANSGKILTGQWRGYYNSGNKKNTGVFNLTGGREGDWQFFFFSGKLKATEHYQNGKLEGRQKYYFENGNFSSEENYLNGQLEGTIRGYNWAGNLTLISNYKLGKKNGEERRFYSNGNLRGVYNYVNDILSGNSTEYYKSGHIRATEQYINGKEDGPYKSYHENGMIATEGIMTNDKAEGAWKYYFESGKLRQKLTYINDKEEGQHEEYFENGQLAVSLVAKKGKINGEASYFDEDGKVYAKFFYENGIIKSEKYFDKSGRLLSASVNKNDLIYAVSYTPGGRKKAAFGYDQKGNLTGPDTIFYPSGKIYQLNMYKNGEFDGLSVTYYIGGAKKSESNLVEGKEDGHYISYYANGKIQSEGWLKDGQDQGEWVNYDELGRLTSKSYYIDGDLNGYKEDYLPNGIKTMEQQYHRGWLETMVQYDSAGKIIAVDSFPKATGKFKLVYSDGKKLAEANYVNGDFDGAYTGYYFDGSIENVSYYKRGDRDSLYTSYYYGGIKNTEGRFVFGNKTGIWKFFDEDGKLNSTALYKNDQINGEKTYYFESGNKDEVSTYKDDELQGPLQKFDPEGALAYRIMFKNDNAESYSYAGADGKLVPEIPIASINGVLKSYYQNGKPSRECGYNDGVKDGRDVVYYNNGQIRSSMTTVNGSAEGTSVEYYKNGKLKSSYNYLNGNAQGLCKEFYANGNLKKEAIYENGNAHGPEKHYDENGKLIKTMIYNYGTLISVTNEK